MREWNEGHRKKKVRGGIFTVLALVMIGNVFAIGRGREEEKHFSLPEYFFARIQEEVMETILPFASFQTKEKTDVQGNSIERMVLQQSPYIAYATSKSQAEERIEDNYFYELLLEEQKSVKETEIQGLVEDEEINDLLAGMEAENAAAVQAEAQAKEQNREEALQVSGNNAEEIRTETKKAEESIEALAQNGFTRVSEKQMEYDWSVFPDTESVVKEFYAVDPTTSAKAAGIDLQSFLQKDLSISKNTEGYQILIFHTHSQESFADSVPGDASTSIVGAGERLTQLLTEEYGYKVLHHTGEYDVEYRDDAYSKALPAVEQILQENSDIQVVIDLHRDEVAEGTKLVTEVQGRPTAKFMFFNGLSYTNQTGKIGYLVNENLSSNLAFSFQMQAACNEYFPGLTRRIYLKGYRYNMHLKERYLLVELGAQTNTVEEIMNACDPLAQMLDMVLSGMVY